MSLDSVFVGSRVQNVSASPKQGEYTGVIINTSDDTFVSAGDISSANAKVLEVSADWATVADAQRILSRLRGFRYQPYEADGALLDPAAELGDAITVGRVYSGIYAQDITFSSLMESNVSAPQEEQIDNEYKYISPQKREYKRQFAEVRASIIVEADRITAEVTRATQAEGTLSTRITQTDNAITTEVLRATEAEGTLSSQIQQTDNAISAEVSRAQAAEGGKLDHTHTSSTFGWALTASAFLLKSNNNTVFKCDSTGVEVTGKVTATSGAIGGWQVSANAIQKTTTDNLNNVMLQSASSASSSAILVRTRPTATGNWTNKFRVTYNGRVTATDLTISGGSININDKFKVDTQGNLTAESGTFRGSVSAGNILYGGSDGSFDGWGITGGSVGTYPLTGGVNTSLGYGDFANEVLNFGTQAAFGNFNSCITQFLHTDNINVADHNLSLKQATVRNAAGTGTTTIFYLGYN